MSKLFLYFLFLQIPGTITVNTKVTADTSSFFCYFYPSDTVPTDVVLTCNQKATSGGKTIVATVYHIVDNIVGVNTQVNNGTDAISVLFQRNGAKIAWSVAANNTVKNGEF